MFYHSRKKVVFIIIVLLFRLFFAHNNFRDFNFIGNTNPWDLSWIIILLSLRWFSFRFIDDLNTVESINLLFSSLLGFQLFSGCFLGYFFFISFSFFLSCFLFCFFLLSNLPLICFSLFFFCSLRCFSLFSFCSFSCLFL